MEPLVAITRSNRIECMHFGYICVTDTNGKIIYNIGDPETPVYLRSTAKPFQAIALVQSGALDKFNLSMEELAITCASHSGQDYHLATVQSILRKIGLSEEHLCCGSAMPYNQEASEALIRKGEKPSQLHNGCSGKHAGMLAVCRYYDYPAAGYCSPEHPVQKLIANIIAEMLGIEVGDIVIGLDGCGIPTFMVSMKQAAYLYSQLAAGISGSTGYKESLEIIQDAMKSYPRMISGDKEFCTELNACTLGKAIGKVGAEGMYCIALPEKRLGICIKITDGRERGLYPAAMHLLKLLEAVDTDAYNRLKHWAYPELKNHKGELVGYSIPVFDTANPSGSGYYKIGRELKLQGMP